MNEFDCCKILYEKILKPQGWYSCAQKESSIAEYTFLEMAAETPISHQLLIIKKNGLDYSFIHKIRYYRGFWPRHLEQKENVVEEKTGFQSLTEIFDFFDDKPKKSVESVRFQF